MNRLTPLLFLTTCLLGCPHRVDFGAEGEIREPAVLLGKVRAAEERVATLDGEGKLKVDGPDAGGTVQLYVAVARPGFLHVEVLDFFGKPQGILISDGERFGFYDAKENRYYQGPASGQNLARFLPIVLPPRELVGLLLGAPPTLGTEKASLSFDAERRAYRLVLERSPAVQTITVDPETFRVLSSEVRGVDAYDASFGDFQRFGEARIPFELRLDAAAAKAKLELRYTNVKVNERPDPVLFDVTPPEGVPVVDVDERGQRRLDTLPNSSKENE